MSIALREVPLFAHVTNEQLQWIALHSDKITISADEILFAEGQPAEHFYVLLAGELQVTKREGSQEIILATHKPGAFTGEIPLLTGTAYIASARATQESRLQRLRATDFLEMLSLCPSVARLLLPVLASRVQTTDRITQQHEKLAALGKLSAGLAHELNNPAAAGQRAAEHLQETLQQLQTQSFALASVLQTEQLAWLASMQRNLLQHACQIKTGLELDALERSDREEALTDWLDEHGIAEGWRMAPTLVEAGLDEQRLDEILAHSKAEAAEQVLQWLTGTLTVGELVYEVIQSTTRITDLVKAIKEYTYMDQAPVQEIDIHVGIENTLTILTHKLKHGIQVTREYDRDLPRICAHGSELNQVWTNIIDNAIDAMQGHGTLHIRTSREGKFVQVEITDNGPGIPPEVQSHIFEPFFTTKGVGEGTGLGLDAVQRIVVRQHHGDIRVSSQPGKTRFTICLPIE